MFDPISNKVVIEPIKVQDKKVGSVLIPGSFQQDAVIGKVIAIRTRWQAPLTGQWIEATVKVGDSVIYGQGAHVSKLDINGKQYVVVSENELLTGIKEE